MKVITDGWYTAYNIKTGVWAIDDNGQDNFYAVLGSRTNCMIDNGFAGGDLEAFMKRLSPDEPWFAVNTHNHIDHAMGNMFFDDVYAHEADIEELDDAEAPIIRKWIQEHPEVDIGGKAPRPYHSFSGTRGRKRTLPLEDGHVFDLGDRKLTAYWVPGHTKGSMCFIDDRTRVLFAGDMLVPLQEWNEMWFHVKNCTDLHTGYESAKRMLSLKDKYDTVASGHGSNYYLDVRAIEELVDVLEGILSGRYRGSAIQTSVGEGLVYRKGKIGIVYDPNRL